jgi:hypothetical protein
MTICSSLEPTRVTTSRASCSGAAVVGPVNGSRKVHRFRDLESAPVGGCEPA